MANSKKRATTNIPLGGEYQVFLNFRGCDIRHGFADTLYHFLDDAQIRIFMDDAEIEPGAIIGEKILQAIDNSKLYIPIFSPSYASSHWCLIELARMMKNISQFKEDENKKVILPIFYDGVEPEELKLEPGRPKLKRPSYLEDFLNLEKRKVIQEKKFTTEDANTWRTALREVDASKGLKHGDHSGDGRLSKLVVEEVVKSLGTKQREVTKDLVGMEDQIAAINNLLDIDSGDDSDCKYEVFLSFRGADTRLGFTDTLYSALVEAGVHVFIDNEELRVGEEIGGNLLEAIEDSRLYIPILSKNYVMSKWCLYELAKMVESTSKSGEDGNKVLLPIFYDVKRDDVKLITQLYRNSLMAHKKKVDLQTIKMWQKALRRVGDIIGFDRQNYTGDGHLSKEVVEKVVNMLWKERRKVKDVRLIGIYGMTGIGKSTLAKIIFNQRYPQSKNYCSFLDDVSEIAKAKGLVKLQKQLLSDMSNSRAAQNIKKIDQGINMIGETICNKKVLIVLDDVDDINQIQGLIGMNSLCSGTRILVTTRDKRVLKIRGFKYEIVPYEMKELSHEDSLQLFSRHAFDKNSPPANYGTLSDKIVSTTGRLPLALEAIGSLLFLQKEKKIWEEKLEKLQKTPHKDVLGKLRISYDALETDQQQIFLDIACFFIGENKTNPIYMWRDCGFSPEDAIDVLISRCMIKITDDYGFWMHNQFRDLGRTIATQEGSRLWARDDIICELKSTEIKRSVQALCLQSDLPTQPPLTVTSDQIERFPHLRFLRFSRITCQGDFTSCFSRLKWFSVRYPGINSSLQDQRPPRFEGTRLENVDVVNLSDPGFTDDEVSSLITGTKKLKVLTLQESDFASNSTIFELSGPRLKQIPLDGLAQLEKLSVEGWKLLGLSIPSGLSKLREVHVSSCTELVELKFLDVLTLMKILRIDNCKSFERLKNLKNLENLKHLTIKGCERLQVLTLQESDLQTLKGLPSNLTVLELSHTQVKQVPLDGLDLLEKLTVEGCEHLEILSIPSNLKKLREVKVSSCTELVEVKFLDVLTSMKILRIENCKSFATLKNLKKLKNLKDLTIKGCERLQVLTLPERDLQTLEGLPSNLTVLELSRIQVKQVPLDGLDQLEKLTVEGCELLVTLSIPSSLSKLREVKLSSCTELFEVQFLDVSRSMKILYIEDCKSLKKLEKFDNLENLKDLIIKGCESMQFLALQKSDLSNLTVLELSRTQAKQVPLDGLDQLEMLTVEGCELLQSLFIPSNLKELREVKVSSCTELVEVKFLDVLTSMKILRIENCKSFVTLKNLKKLKNLKDLIIKGCERLQVLTLPERDLQTLEGLPSNLTVLELSRTQVKQVPLDGLDQLEKLTVEGCELLETLFIPSSLSKLREVKVSSCTELFEVQFLDVSRSMETLYIEDCKSLEKLEKLENLENLKDLGIKRCENLQVVKGIDELKLLLWLTVERCGSVERIVDALCSKIPNTCEISITDCGELLDTGRVGSSITFESYREILN